MAGPVVFFGTPMGAVFQGTKYVADVTRSWLWNEAGPASFLMASAHPDLERLIEWGNIVWITEPGLPTWVGVIEDRDWSEGQVQLNLKSAEYLLKGQITDQGLRLGGDGKKTSADILREATLNAWGNGWTPLSLGSLTSDKKHFKEFDYTDLSEIWPKVAEEDKYAFWVDDKLKVNYAPRRGVYRQTLLVQNKTLINVSVQESISEVITNALGLGAGSDLVDQPKLLRKIPSNKLFRAEVLEFNEAIDQGALNDPVNTALKERFNPVVTVDAEIPNRNNLWSQVGIGDEVIIGYYTTRYKTVRATVKALELSSGEAMRCTFETKPEVPPSDPIPWVIS